MKQIRCYVTDETYQKLRETSKRIDKTIGQVASEILKENYIQESMLEDIIFLLKDIITQVKKIDEIFSYLRGLEVSETYILRTLTAIGWATKKHTGLDPAQGADEIAKKVEKALENIQKAKQKQE